MSESTADSNQTNLARRVAASILTIRKAWSEHTLGVLLSTVIVIFGVAWSSYSLILDFSGKTVVEKSAVAAGSQADQQIVNLKVEMEGLRKQLSERDASIVQLKDERSSLLNDCKDKLEKEQRQAERTATNLQNRVIQERETKEGMKSEFPSLVSRGLWDRGQPSPKSILNARTIEGTLGEHAVAVLESPDISAREKALVAEVIAQYAESVAECASYSARLQTAIAVQRNYQARISVGVFSTGMTEEEVTQYNREQRAANAAVSETQTMARECSVRSAHVLSRVRDALDQFRSSE
jgi:hypothetical protein